MDPDDVHFDLPGFDYEPDYYEPDAQSSPGPHSSPILNRELSNATSFLLDDPMDEDSSSSDSNFEDPTPRAPPLSNEQKAENTLAFMKTMNKFSLRAFIGTVFTSKNDKLSHAAGIFESNGGIRDVMDMWWTSTAGTRNTEMSDWVIEKAAEICSKEANKLSQRASAGPHAETAASLRLSPEDVTVKTVTSFRLSNLTATYNRVLPFIQKILRAIVGKDEERDEEMDYRRDPTAGRTLATSMLLNLRSRRLNFHAAMNSLIFWDNQVSKRMNQMFNIFGVTTSTQFQLKSIAALRKSSVALSRMAANARDKIQMVPYDNFNWISRAWEATALHGSVSHDEVSAILVILPTPAGLSASEVTNIAQFAPLHGTRHRIPARESLTDICPSAHDQQEFRRLATLHVLEILATEIQDLSRFKSSLPKFGDASAITPIKTEEYYLPTFDQEQGSTRGNMVVLEHYFGKVLDIPIARFEETMYTVLGDRLTTVRDRAAQDQRAVDRSSNRFDHLSSFSITSGLMHFSLNFIQAVGSNAWGASNTTGPVSLSTLCNTLPNRSDINLRKVDYYAWLRFLDVVLRALVLRASSVLLGGPQNYKNVPTIDSLCEHATNIVDSFLLPSPSRLEALEIKTHSGGNSDSGNASLLMHDLMTLREMQHAVKHGHPSRILRMIKYWMPMFYAAGSFNYSNECMELLHNYIHNWPKNYAQVAFNGMLVNPRGRPDGFKPTDLHLEHLNDKIKERARGPNATPDLLEKITPIMGLVSTLTNQLFEDIGVDSLNQRHSAVSQHTDVRILADHLQKFDIFDFSKDKPSPHAMINLFDIGLGRLAGKNGGHAKHLARHQLRLRSRHNEPDESEPVPGDDLETAVDGGELNFTVLDDISRIE